MAYTTIKFGSLTLGGSSSGSNTVTRLSKTKVPGTLKTRYNEIIAFTPIPGRAKDTRVEITGTLQGTTRDADRSTLKSYDDGSIRRYEDGIDDDDYIIEPGSLVLDDESDIKTVYNYSIVIITF